MTLVANSFISSSNVLKLSTRSLPLGVFRFQSNLASERGDMNDYEFKIFSLLKEKLNPKLLMVKDISGGCGSMFAIQIESHDFKGLTMIKQHRLVNDILKDEISQWHGLQLKTKAIQD